MKPNLNKENKIMTTSSINPTLQGVSVVIPLFQKERHIVKSLESAALSCILEGCDFELVVVNDGSTDGSVAAIVDWVDSNPSLKNRLNLNHQENSGAAAARNTGWKAARFETILFLDADDIWMPGHVTHIVKLMRDFPDAVLYADAWSEISPSGERKFHTFGIGTVQQGYIPCFFEAMSSGPMIASSSTAATRKSHLQQSGGFPEGISHGEDKVGWGRLALLGPMAWSPVIGAVWDKSADNRSDNGTPAASSAFRDFLEEARNTAEISETMRQNIEIAIAVEEARISGEITIYDHDTPNTFRQKISKKPDFPG